MVRVIPEQVFTHAVQDNLISRKQFQRLLITVKEVLNATHRVQLFRPFEESEPERLLKGTHNKIKLQYRTAVAKTDCCVYYCG